MAKKQATARSAPPKASPRSNRADQPTLSFSRINAIYLGTGAASIAAGFFLLSQGSMTLAPILLVLGYCVLIPIGIIKK